MPFTTVPIFGVSLRYQRRELHVPPNTPIWPQAPERTGPRSAAVLVRRMRASMPACSEVSSAAPAPSVARGTLGRGRLRSTRFRLASGESVRPVGTHGAYVQLPDFSVSHAAYRGSRAHCGGSHTERRADTRVWNPSTWPQAPERIGPRSAAILVRRMRASTQAQCRNAGQYVTVMQPRAPQNEHRR